jgi:KDO2-lipid IV(A) lauroyltransferase
LAIGFEAVIGLARILPYRAFRDLCVGLMALYYRVAGRRLRRAAFESLEVAWPGRLSLPEKERIAKAAYVNLVRGFVGQVHSGFHPGPKERFFEIQGRDGLDAALRQGKGAVFAIAHFGPFTWMLDEFVRSGYRVNVLMRPPRSSAFCRQFRGRAQEIGINLIYSVPVRDCVVSCLAALKRGELVFLPVDQNYGGPGRVFVDFFGRLAGTATGPAVFAQKTGAPIFFAHALPLAVPPAEKAGPDNERFRIIVSPQIMPARGANERESLVGTTARLTTMVEDLARQYPEQWSWMHRRWKAVPKDGEI